MQQKSLVKTYNYIKINKQNISIKDIVDIKLLNKNIFNNDNYVFGNTQIKYNKNIFKVTKQFDIEVLKIFNKYHSHIDKETLNYLKKENEFNNIEETILVCILEVFIALELLNDNSIKLNDFLMILKHIDYIDPNIKKQLQNKRNYSNNSKNTDLLQTNLNNIEYPKDLNKIKSKKLKNLLLNINLPLIEIPIDKDLDNLVSFFENLNDLKKELRLKRFNFSLRLKKILKKGKEGMYIVNNKTIILDPRKPNSIYHEIGHYIYENKLSFTYNDKRFYYSKFINIIKKEKKIKKQKLLKHNIEDCDLNSEIFAYWFEDLFK